MNIQETYNNWEKTSYITEGQLDYLKRLHKKITNKNSFNEYMKDNLHIQNINQIKYSDYSKITKFMESKIKLDKDQLQIIKNKYNLEQIFNICSVNKYSDLTLYNLRKLLRYNTSIAFHIMIEDKTSVPINEVFIINYSDKYEYGIQKSKSCPDNKMFYIRFYDMLVLDYDDVSYDQLIEYLEPFKEDFLFRIYKTYKGFHVFITSHVFSHNDDSSIYLAKDLECDLTYIVYSKFNGYNIRLTPKIGYNETITHTFVSEYGSGTQNPNFTDCIQLFEKLNKDPPILNKENDTNLFYDEYIKIVNTRFKNKLNNDSINFLKNKYFIDHIIKNNKITFELVKILSAGYIDYISKPQRCFITTENEYLAVDMNTNLHYICFKNIMMIDIDNNDIDTPHKINSLMNKYNDSYMLFKTTNGYHLFITNRYANHNDESTINYMIDFNCDINYIICTYLRGFCVRLNKKNNEEPDNLYTLVLSFNEQNSNKEIVDKINTMHNFIGKFTMQLTF
jgi:hypothetical protein